MRMKVITLVMFILATAGAITATAAPDSVPVPPDGVVDFQGRTQLVVNIGDFDVLAELLGRTAHVTAEPGFFGSVTLGGYYRVLKNLKVGAFYRLQDGAHHDDDWVDTNGVWGWQDTSARLENILMLDVSPRFLLGFLPGRNWVFMLKGRYEYNFFNNYQSIMARPELTYFWIQDRVPILNVSLSYEMYFPLNFGSTLLYDAWPYLTLLWHATPDVAFELGGAYRTTVWSTSADAVAASDPRYQAYFNSFAVTLGVVITLAY
jgi:hypothetical protein